jgi:hypothetical protein
MRFYNITITPPAGATQYQPITFTSLNSNGGANGSALQVDVDIFQTWGHQPAQNGYLKISGIDFNLISYANNMNPIPQNFGEGGLAQFWSITIQVGMSKGLPYANPRQIGTIIQGSILQSFANWQGNQTSLDLIITGGVYVQPNNINLKFSWNKNQTLQDAVTNTLNTAYNNPKITGTFSDTLKYTEVQPGQYPNFNAFAKSINQLSKQINTDKNYQGASMAMIPGGFALWDGSTPSEQEIIQIEFQDIIGNVTWQNVNTIQVKLVMRGDLDILDQITIPSGFPFINTANSFAKVRFNMSFDGTYTISQIRHVGNSRQGGGNNWCTIIDAIANRTSQ